ncbi:Piwi domain containing protein [Lactarius tabidus]
MYEWLQFLQEQAHRGRPWCDDGGINLIPDSQGASFLTDPVNPTTVIGADITHPPPRNRGRPSFTSLVGSIDANVVQYASRMNVQSFPLEVIEGLENSTCPRSEVMGKLPKRILFYRAGVSESELKATPSEGLPSIRNASVQPNFNFTITFTVVGKDHKFVFFPEAPVVEGGQPPRNPNCPPGAVIDTVVTNPVECDFYLCSHQEVLGTSKLAHYNILLEENNFTTDVIQSLSATSTRAAPAPSPNPHLSTVSTRLSLPHCVAYLTFPQDAYNVPVCTRAKNHSDPQAGQQLFTAASDVESTTPSQAASGAGNEGSWVTGFQKTHGQMSSRIYFC